MLSTLEALPRLLQAILRHLFAYGELLYAETVETVQRARRRLLGLVVAFTAAVMAVALGCLWVIAATWDGPNRLMAVGGLCLGFILVAVLAGVYAAGTRAPGGNYPELRLQWREDLQEIAQLDPGLVGRPPAAAAGVTGAGHE